MPEAAQLGMLIVGWFVSVALQQSPFQALFVGGIPMKLSLHYKTDEYREQVEKEVVRHVAKLERWLRHYEPDLVQLHGTLGKHPRNDHYVLTLNLTLPTGTLRVTEENAEARYCARQAFDDLELQIKKHQARLRKDYEWKRKRVRKEVPA